MPLPMGRNRIAPTCEELVGFDCADYVDSAEQVVSLAMQSFGLAR
jgi:hypothetical protein